AGRATFTTPQGFQSYAINAGFPSKRTAACISVDSIKDLSPELREANSMIFRLGNEAGSPNTLFAIARAINGWSDYFLIDDELFASQQPRPYVPTVKYSALYAFMLLPVFTETSVVNLALASGLLPHALGVDPGYEPSIPATGQSVFSFPV